MATNKFATMLHRSKTPKIAIVLIYTLLEWTLIALLLINALFSYLIASFAEFFGLRPPCLLCNRVDHLFGPRKPIARLICEPHAAEVSKLAYCASHRNLADAASMCEDCAPAADRAADLLSWMKRSEGGDEKGADLSCSCCGVTLETQYLVFKPSSWGALEYAKEESDDSDAPDREEKGSCENFKIEDQREVDVESLAVTNCKDASLDLIAERSLMEVEERLVPVELIDSSTLIRSEFSSAVSDQEEDGRDYVGYNLVEKEDIALDIDATSDEDEEEKIALLTSREISDAGDLPLIDVVEEEDSFPKLQCVVPESIMKISEEVNVANVEILVDEIDAQVEMIDESEGCGDFQVTSSSGHQRADPEAAMEIFEEGIDAKVELIHESESYGELQITSSSEHQCEGPEPPIEILEEGVDEQGDSTQESEGYAAVQGIAVEDDTRLMDAEANCEISIGSEICDHEQIDLPQFNEPAITPSACLDEQFSSSCNMVVHKEQVTEYEYVKETIVRGISGLSIYPELNEVEDERLPETPTSIDSLHALHKRFMFERREYGTESLDGSVASEIDGSEILNVDHLKAALKAERKALSALYMELEEERSASAIAANQTMAMITRLQEEKAAVQMEALQYQRMMEEQSEYDQEALQLLNELMMKREKEKQELEKELEVYRKKVIVYEAKERRKAAERSKINGCGSGSGTSSASSNADESDDLSFDSHEGEDCSYRHSESNQNTPADDVLSSGAEHEAIKHQLTLDESLADFEEERLSILEQLKALEEKLFSIDENGQGVNGDYEFSSDDVHVGLVNGFDPDLDADEKLNLKQRSMVGGGKRLLPLFDATISVENEDDMSRETVEGSPGYVSKPAIDDHKRLAIAEEVDNVYERLQALEADREFLKHCIRSLKKGNKGMDLLQEILQHLRDLRNVEIRVRSAGDALASLSA